MLLVACGNFFDPKHEAQLNNPNNPSGENETNMTIPFSEVRAKIFEPHCTLCHSEYGNYFFVKQDVNAILAAVLQNRMPDDAPPLDGELKKLLTNWINQGAPEFVQGGENTSSPQPAPIDELQATWDSLHKRIFVPKCTICHSPEGEAPWVDLTSREAMSKTLIAEHINFQKPEESNLIFRLRHKEAPMPPLPPFSNIPQLTEGEIEIVLEWIKRGLP